MKKTFLFEYLGSTSIRQTRNKVNQFKGQFAENEARET